MGPPQKCTVNEHNLPLLLGENGRDGTFAGLTAVSPSHSESRTIPSSRSKLFELSQLFVGQPERFPPRLVHAVATRFALFPSRLNLLTLLFREDLSESVAHFRAESAPPLGIRLVEGAVPALLAQRHQLVAVLGANAAQLVRLRLRQVEALQGMADTLSEVALTTVTAGTIPFPETFTAPLLKLRLQLLNLLVRELRVDVRGEQPELSGGSIHALVRVDQSLEGLRLLVREGGSRGDGRDCVR